MIVAVVLAAIASGSTLAGFSIGMTSRATPTIAPLTGAGIVLAAVLLGAVAVFLPARALLHRKPAGGMTCGP